MNEETKWGQAHVADSQETAIVRTDENGELVEVFRLMRKTPSGCDLDAIIEALNEWERQ